MTKFTNPGLMPTSRRNILRGTALAGAAVFAAALPAKASTPRRLQVPTLRAPSPHVVKVQAEAIAAATPADLSGLKRVRQELVAPPFAPVHEQVATGDPKIVEIEMVTHERLMVVDEDTGASIWALTFNGSVPGPLIIVHQGDYVELTLRNPVASMMEHNIDFHASTGALGGGALTHI